MQDGRILKVEDVIKLAEQKHMPKHIIERFLFEIEIDANGNVIDSTSIEEKLDEFLYDIAITNLLKDPEFIKELEEQKALKKEG